MSFPIIMHINSCEQGQTLEEACRYAAKTGFDGIEFRSRRLNHPQESLIEYLDAVKTYTQRYNIQHTFFGMPGIDATNPDPAVRQASVDSFKVWLDEASKRFDLSIINFFAGAVINHGQSEDIMCSSLHGSAAAKDWQWETAAEACQEIADYAKPLGCQFAFEAHMYYLHDYAETARKLCDMIDRDNFGINLDYGNSVYFDGIAPLEQAIDICGEKLFYIHFKNTTPIPGGRLPTPLSDGSINHRTYLRKLKEVNYQGCIAIEQTGPGDRAYHAKEDLAYVKSLLADLA